MGAAGTMRACSPYRDRAVRTGHGPPYPCFASLPLGAMSKWCIVRAICREEEFSWII